MGCFNHTCAVSNLPISWDDEVMVFLLARNKWWSPEKPNNMALYPDYYYKIVGFPFVARYNDYGWIEKEEKSVFVDWTLDLINENLIERELGENEYHDHAVVRGQVDINKLGDLFHGDRLWLKNDVSHYSKTMHKEIPTMRPVSFMLVHKKIFDDLINNISFEFYEWTDGKVEDKIWTMQYYIDKLSSKVLFPKEEEVSESELKDIISRYNVSKEEALKIRKILKDFRTNASQDFPQVSGLFSILEDVPDVDRVEAGKRMGQIAAFDSSMRELFKFYHPQLYGSQDRVPSKQFDVLLNSMNEMIKEVKKEYEED